MGSQLSPETEAALRKLAREIGTARGLDEEAQEELYGHLEDKTLGYLAGDESLSEADAALLARTHLGRPHAQLGDHAQLSIPIRSQPFAQMVLTIAVVDLAMGVTFSALCGSDTALRTLGLGALYSDSLVLFVMLLVFGSGLFVMNRTASNRKDLTGEMKSPWYLHLKTHWLVLALCGLLVLRWAIPGRLDLFGIHRFRLLPAPDVWEWLGVMTAVLWAGTWVRCIRRANRSFAALATCGAVWTLLRLSFNASKGLFGRMLVYHDTDGNLAWMLEPGRVFREPNDLFAISKSIVRILWNSGAAPLAFITLIAILYVLQHHLIRAIGMYVRNYRSEQRGMPWVLD